MMKDIVRRHKIRDVDLLSRVIGYVMSETGYVFSAASILLPNVRFTRMAMGDVLPVPPRRVSVRREA